ncbi:hypothetical protein GCM10010503_40720 [Streptomyces lucensis JCM 4490]|uniref:Uncharacterized protein n=1 Tax=Streptomyces lucensis JCM 4490 TaxID=1306176 RepID=A0A918MRJ9_9ACTN|nr:hypothetical protein GCM10010503_40720 [Streptomyces lucensis JCM 4490]
MLVLSSAPILDVMTYDLMVAAFRWVTSFGGGRRYLVFLLCLRGRRPYRLARFLHWAHEGGLLRTSGGAYQFRHREFQRWVAHRRQPGTAEGPRARRAACPGRCPDALPKPDKDESEWHR